MNFVNRIILTQTKRLLSHGWMISLLTLSQHLFKVSTLRPHTSTKMATPLVNCIVNDGLIDAVSDVHQTLLEFASLATAAVTGARHGSRHRSPLLLDQRRSGLWLPLPASTHRPKPWQTGWTSFVCTADAFQQLASVSQDSVATHLRCSGISFTTNFLRNPSLKEFWKSVKIWQSYCHKYRRSLFWDTGYIMYFLVSKKQNETLRWNSCAICFVGIEINGL